MGTYEHLERNCALFSNYLDKKRQGNIRQSLDKHLKGYGAVLPPVTIGSNSRQEQHDG
jgi:hypothetical protein